MDSINFENLFHLAWSLLFGSKMQPELTSKGTYESLCKLHDGSIMGFLNASVDVTSSSHVQYFLRYFQASSQLFVGWLDYHKTCKMHKI